MNLLLLLSEGMSLKKWDEQGQLSRELNIYQKLGENIGIIYIHSYGKREYKYLAKYPNLKVLDKPWFIPDWQFIPKRIKKLFINVIYKKLELCFRSEIFSKIQVIKTNQFSDYKFATEIKKKFSAKLIFRMGYYHTIDQSRFNSVKNYSKQVIEEDFYFKISDAIIVANLEARNYIAATYNLKDEKVRYIPNYIDTDLFKPINVQKEFDILFVGRFTLEKNLIYMLDNLIEDTMKILFIGSGPLKETIISTSKAKKVDLTILERIENNKLPEYYSKCKIFILPSLYESNPKVLLEAMSCGSVCIGADVKGINNIIDDGVTGFLFNNSTIQGGLLIKKTLNNYNNLYGVQKAARNYILENLSLNNNILKEIGLIKNLMKGNF